MSRSINPVPQYLDGAGNPLVDGKLYFFESGTSTPKTTYADVNLTIPNEHPVLLDGAGRVPNIFFTGTARARLDDSDDVQIWDRDPVGAPGLGGDFEEWVPQVIYNQNDIVEGSDGNFYLSFADGNQNNDPTTSPQFWQQIEFINVWNEFVSYEIGDTVKASDNLFYSSLIEPNLGNDPTTSPSAWGSPIALNLSNPGPIGDGNPDTGAFTALTLTAISGILAADTTIVDHAIFSAPIDRTTAPVSAKMLATVSHAGTDLTFNIYDLMAPVFTDLTPLATVVIPGITGVNAVAAESWYVGAATLNGVHFISPESGKWAPKTTGMPRSVAAPEITDDNVNSICAGFALQPVFDPATGGDLPSWGWTYGAGVDSAGLYKDDGAIFSAVIPLGAIGAAGCAIDGGRFYFAADESGSNAWRSSADIQTILADDWVSFRINQNDNSPFGFGAETDASAANGRQVLASAEGLTFVDPVGGSSGNTVSAIVNRVFNTGKFIGDIRGLWICNDLTADRSYKANTLTENGIVTLAAVEVGAELQAASGFTAANNLTAASNADWDAIGTGALHQSIWFKSAGNAAIEQYMNFANAGNTVRFLIRMEADGTIQAIDDGAAGSQAVASIATFDDGLWHRADWVRRSSTDRELYIDGVSVGVDTNDAGSLSDAGNLPFAIGVDADGSTSPATSSELTLSHMSATAPSAAQVRDSYEFMRGAFEVDALCLLQSGTTDAVLKSRIDPITGNAIVTQADSAIIMDGGVVAETLTIPVGGTTWKAALLNGDARSLITDANIQAETVAKDVRGVLDEFEAAQAVALADLNLGEAKAWGVVNQTSFEFLAGFNIKSVTDLSAGRLQWNLAVPFKTANYVVLVSANSDTTTWSDLEGTPFEPGSFRTITRTDGGGTPLDSSLVCVACFGELDNG